jgi:hypothetical protein
MDHSSDSSHELASALPRSIPPAVRHSDYIKMRLNRANSSRFGLRQFALSFLNQFSYSTHPSPLVASCTLPPRLRLSNVIGHSNKGPLDRDRRPDTHLHRDRNVRFETARSPFQPIDTQEEGSIPSVDFLPLVVYKANLFMMAGVH